MWIILIAPLTGQDQPNVLLIIADDLGVDRLNGYHTGEGLAATPTLDSLRAVGLTFTNAWAAPVCSPSRAALMTGQYGVNNGVEGVPGNLSVFLPSLFREIDVATNNAYATALIGKWHLTQRASANDPLAFGMDHYDGFLSGSVGDYFSWPRTRSGSTSTSTEYASAALTNAATEWVSERHQPWFLWLAHGTPHTPYHIPPAGTFSVANTADNTGKYLAMIENLDHEIGSLLNGLTEEERANTLVIFVGDNGTPGNVLKDYPDRRGKGSLYQGGLRVPFILAGAGITRKGEREDGLVNIVDLHATILSVVGAELAGGLQNSFDFSGLLTDGTATTRPFNYIDLVNTNGNARSGYAIRNDDYKLIQFDDGGQEFYAVSTDSFETNDLINSLTPATSDILSELLAEGEAIRNGWSCNDLIQNGDETGIDCGTSACGSCTTSTLAPAEHTMLRLYPNPTNDLLTLFSEKALINYVEVCDAAGQFFFKQKAGYSQSLKLDLGSLPAGVYSVGVRFSSGAWQTHRVVRR
ncbi:hypothetical protein A3850_002935 [Lewinella sp. 4G2]|nr:hypothetical protein A3850_002935 [Lewinella sp. 4G2]